MLILKRLKGESILIGNDIELKIINVKGRQVYVGVKAPAHLEVDRNEVRRSKERNRQAAHDDSVDY